MSQHDTNIAMLVVELIDDSARKNAKVDIANVLAHVNAYYMIPHPIHQDVDGKKLGDTMQADIQGANK